MPDAKRGPAALVRTIVGLGVLLLFAAVPVRAAPPAAPIQAGGDAVDPFSGRLLDPSKGPFAAGAAVYQQHCAACHDTAAPRAPQRVIIQEMSAQAIHRALTEGAMRGQATALTDREKVDVAEYLGNRKLVADAEAPTNRCTGAHAVFDLGQPPVFTGWGLDPEGTHAIPTAVAGLDRRNAGKLKLKWAFGFPGSQRMRSQPALAGGSILLGNHTGRVYALDRETGCVRWTFNADAEVRTGVIVDPWRAGDKAAKPRAYFGDVVGNAYAIDTATGRLVWKKRTDEHPATVLTGTPTLYQGTLYVPVSSLEELTANAPGYPCCSFRGSVLALDAATGAEKWRTWLADPPKSRTDSKGAQFWGPSGVSVWNAPAIDVKRGQLYVATGDNYTQPATALSDSVVAMDLATGRIKWHYQALGGDAWNAGCMFPARINCPDNEGPDHDFGAGVILAKGKNGRELVLAGQKSGDAYGIDPDSGKLVWRARVGKGGMGGGVLFGMAAAGGRLFVPIMDKPEGPPGGTPERPGIYALDLATGAPAWKTAGTGLCREDPLCYGGYDGAVSATPELLLAGAADGHLRVFDNATGKLLWEMDTVRDFATVNGVKAKGGAISGGAAPLAYKGELIAVSGYSFGVKMPGNVLLVFEAK